MPSSLVFPVSPLPKPSPFQYATIGAASRARRIECFERIQFVQVSASARPEVSAQFLSELGCGGQTLDALRRLGARTEYADKKSGYAQAAIPRDKLFDTLVVTGTEYAYTCDDDRIYCQDLDAKIPQAKRKPEPVPVITVPYPRVAMTLAADGPFYGAAAIELPELWKEHPEAEGSRFFPKIFCKNQKDFARLLRLTARRVICTWIC
jgi:hypothetical protein